MNAQQQRVAIVIPVLNEERYLERVVLSLASQAPENVVEIIIVDGGSTDDSLAIASALAEQDPRLRVLMNPKRVQSAAVNLAARAADTTVNLLLRADAHAEYSSDFIDELLRAHRESGAQSVVNRLRSQGKRSFQRAVAAVSNSPFGTGGAVHRSGGYSGFVDHGHHALFDRAWFERIGGYDESFVANEDAEFDTRLRAAGGKIWFTSRADIVYFPRDSVRGLLKQYYRYGVGRAGTRSKHGEPLRIRQLIPPALVVVLLVSLVLALWTPWMLAVPVLYMLGVAAATIILIARLRDAAVLGAMAALPSMHVAWGAGFLRGTLLPRSEKARA